MKRLSLLSLAVALVIGLLLAWLLVPRWRDVRALASISRAEPEIRETGWSRLLAPGRSGEPRAEIWLTAINRRLVDAPDDALRDGSAHLHRIDRWGWAHQPSPLVLRMIALQADDPDPSAQAFAAEMLKDCPQRTIESTVLPMLATLVASESAEVRRSAFDAALAYAGPERPQFVLILPVPESDTALRDRRRLARSWLVEPPSERKATRNAADSAAALTPDEVRSRLDGPPAEPDGSVHAAVLLAERSLERAESAALAERWIRSFDDGEKRAGALLAALLGEHAELLARLHEAEDVADVRLAQRLALWVLGREAGPESGVELAHRGLRRNGAVDPDVVLLILAAGERDGIAQLTRSPAEGDDITEEAVWRGRLIERFLPDWHRLAGAPPARPQRSVERHFEYLDVRRALTRHSLEFDEARKIYVDTQMASADG